MDNWVINLNKNVNLLLEHGHIEAGWYPIKMLWDEVGFVVERVNSQDVTRTVLLQLAVGSILSKKSGDELKRVLKRLSENGNK